ncbi:hypothetical protein niasHT_036280 [Heterodera trifolii]|uniref:C2 domain-containing protein n=1 Tax=Heterodera trifolii TaxID=157864 RepID=A0ABD2J072_9BILA
MLDPYKQQPNFFLPHPNHYDHPDQHRHRQRTHRQHRSTAVAGRHAVGPPMPPPPPQRMPSPNCCSSSAATSSVVSEPISLDLATEQYFVKEKENWAAGRFSRRVPPRPLRRTAGAEQHGLVIPLDRFRTKNFSRRPNNDAFDSSDDEYYDEGDFERRRPERFDWHARRYSTSDLTTSDSELGRLGTGKPYRLGIKCPSVSTINPDDSSLSFEDLEQQMIYQQPIKLGGVRRYHRHQPNQKQRRGVISSGTNFYDFDDDDGTENCGAKSDAELTDRAPPSYRYRSGSHRMLQRRMNAAADDGGSPPPSRGTQSAPRTPQRHAVPPALEMIEEISPILPRPVDVRDDLDIPPLPRPLKLSKEWRPLQTSTLTNFHATLPKTNPHHSSATKLPPIAPLEPPRSLFDPQYTAMCFGTTSDEFKPIRSEQFNLPSVMAKAKGIRGILFLQLCVSGDSVLKVQIRNGAYFLKSLPISSFVKVEIRRSISNRRRDKYAHHHEKRQRFCSRVTYPVSQNNQPEFYEEFMFRVTRTHLEHGDKLGISVFVQHSGEEKTPELLGGMSFSLVKMMKMAQLHTTSSQQCFFHYDDHQSHLPMGDVTVKLYEGGFFLLPDKKALTSKFAQDKISIRKYYDDIGGSTTMSTTASSSMGSPFRMMNEPEWTTAVARFGIGAGGAGGVVPTAMGAPNLRNGCGPPPLPRRLFSPSRKASATYHHQHHHNQLMALAPPASAQLPAATAATAASCPIGGESSAADTSHYTTSNSSSSGAQSAVDCKRTRGGCAGTVATATTVGCPTVIDRLAPANGASAAAQQPPAVPPPSVNTTDTTTSDFTSSGFTSSSPTNCGTVQMLIGHHQHQQLPTMAPVPIETSSSLANSFSSGCAEVGAGGADGGGVLSSSDESSSSSSSSSSSPVVVELATNDVGPVQAASADGQQQQQQQFRKASLQHHYSPMRVHRGGGGGGCANGGNRSSPQKVGPTSPLKQQQQASSAELVDPYNNNSAMQQQSSSPTTKRRGGGGRLRSALAATTDNTMVRRVASFTFSPPLRAGSLQHNQLQHQLQQQQFLSALDKHCNSSSSNNSAAGALRLDKRNSVASGGGAGGTDKLQRRMAL